MFDLYQAAQQPGGYSVGGKTFGGFAPGQWSFDSGINGGSLSPEFLRSIGYQGDPGVFGSFNGPDGGNGYSPEFQNWLDQSGLRFATQYDNEASNNYHIGAFDSTGKQVGQDYIQSANDDPGGIFGLAILAATGFAGAAAAGVGAAAGAAGGSGAGAAGGLSAGDASLASYYGGLGGVDGSLVGSGVGLGGAGAGAAGAGADTLAGYYGGLGGADGSLLGSGVVNPATLGGAGAAGGAGALGSGGLGAGGAGAAGAGGLGSAGGAAGAASSLIPGISNGTLLQAGTALGSGLLQQSGINSAVDAQTKAAQDANALAKYMYDTTRTDNLPALQARNNALAGLNGLMADPSSVTQQPGYQFGLQQGQQGLDRAAAVRGGLMSGAQLKATDRYNQDYAGTKLNDSYNRLASIAGVGQVGANTIGQAGQNYANNAGQNMLGAGNAQAAGAIGSANAWGGALSSIYNNYQLQDLLKKYGGGG